MAVHQLSICYEARVKSQMQTKQFSGVHAALLTPRTPAGVVDIEALKKLVRFLMAKEIDFFAVNGATGEFCMMTAEELRVVLRVVREAGAARILCGVGAPTTNGAIERAAIANDEGAAGLLLPMPTFFRYEQDDLYLYCRTVADSTNLPVLLYNLPQFSSCLEKETVLRLIVEAENIVGIKDSSGSLDILRHLSHHKANICRLVGNDTVLAQALRENICDGVVSGVACALPELVLHLFKQPVDSEQFQRSAHLLVEFVAQLNQFPVPWGLKWAVESRGIASATFAQPITEARTAQARDFSMWLKKWLPDAVSPR